MVAKVKEHQLKSVDIMGPLMDLLSGSIEETPYYEPGIVHRLDDAYFKKIDAIEFAVNMMMVKTLKVYQKPILFY